MPDQADLPFCDHCDNRCWPDDWSDVANAFVCPRCMEEMIAAHHPEEVHLELFR